MNWGGFAGGFSQGFSNGAAMGKMYNEASKQDKLDKMRAEGIAEAQAARQSAIDAAVKDTQAKAASDAGVNQPPAPGQQAGQVAPDTADVQTQAVTPQTPEMASQPVPVPPMQGQPSMPQAQPVPQAAPAISSSAMPTGDGAVKPQAAPPAAGGFAGAPKRYNVGGKGFDSLEEARAHADKVLPAMVDYQVKYVMPKMAQGLMEQGRPEEAQKLIDWAGQRTSQRHLEDWNKAVLAFQTDDFDTAAKKLAGLHKDFPDGNDIVTQEPVKDKAGKTVGFNMSIKGEDGKTQKQYVDARQLIEYGLSTLSPDKMFAQMSSRQQSYDTLKAKADYDTMNDARTATRQESSDIRKDSRTEAADIRRAQREAKNAEVQHGYKLEELTTAEKLKQEGIGKEKRVEVQSNIDLLKENGYSPEEVKGMIPALLKAGEFKKATSPDEARRMIVTELAKDPMFNTKPRDKQQDQVDSLMQLAAAGSSQVAPNKPTTVPNPMAQPAPAKPAAQQKPKGIPVFDSKTGSIVYR